MSVAIRDAWPTDLRVVDPIPPLAILEHQAKVLAQRTKGELTASIQKHLPDDRIVWGFDVHSSRLGSVRLFEVHAAKDLLYPVRIVPPDVKIPRYLQRERYVPGAFESAVGMTQGRRVENDWVASTDVEFTAKLEKLLATDEVMSLLMSFLSRSQPAAE